MAILPPGTPGRLPAVPVPAAIRPPLPIVPVAPVADRTVGSPASPGRPPPGTLIDTWADAGAQAAPASPPPPSPAPLGPGQSTLATFLLRNLGPPVVPAAQAQAPARGEATRPAPVALALPLPDPDSLADSTQLLARSLRVAVEASGLFYESHLAEWVQGQRSLEEVRGEAMVVSAARAAHAEAGEPDPVRNQQVDYLRQGEAGWTLPPPWKDRATLWISEEAPDSWHESADSARMGLDLDLPGRGRVQVTLRLRGADLRADVVNGPATHLAAPELAALAQRLSHVPGTRLAALRIESALDAPRAAPEQEAWRHAGNAD